MVVYNVQVYSLEVVFVIVENVVMKKLYLTLIVIYIFVDGCILMLTNMVFVNLINTATVIFVQVLLKHKVRQGLQIFLSRLN